MSCSCGLSASYFAMMMMMMMMMMMVMMMMMMMVVVKKKIVLMMMTMFNDNVDADGVDSRMTSSCSLNIPKFR